MNDLIEALQIFAKYMSGSTEWPTGCEHDELRVYCETPPEEMSPVDAARLETLSFSWDEGSWLSFRFGSA